MTKDGIDVSYHKALRGKALALSTLMGEPGESYGKILSFLHVLKEMNPGTVTHCVIDADDKFVSLFFALGACIKGFEFLRKVIVIDGTHLKTKFKGVLLVCTAQDGNKHQYPLAFGVVKNESDSTWKWFLEKLIEVIPGSEDLVIISDKNTCIIKLVETVYPKASHGYCSYHISQNIRNRVNIGRGSKNRNEHRDSVVSKFIGCAEAYTVQEFDKCFDDLTKRQPPTCVKFHEYIRELLLIKECWVRCFFKCSRYNILTSNGVESINAVLVKTRTLPVVIMLDEIVKLISRWFNNHRNEALEGGSSQVLTPEVETTLHARKHDSSFFRVVEINKMTREYVVRRIGSLDADEFYVNLRNKTCSCRVFDIDQIPCAHAISAFSKFPADGKELESLCSEFYTKFSWAMAYDRIIYPVSSISNWNIPAEIQAIRVVHPDYLKRPGRVQTVRMEAGGQKLRKKSKRQKDPRRF